LTWSTAETNDMTSRRESEREAGDRRVKGEARSDVGDAGKVPLEGVPREASVAALLSVWIIEGEWPAAGSPRASPRRHGP